MDKAHSDSAAIEADPDRDRAERGAQRLDRLAEMAMERAEAMQEAALAAIKAGDAAKSRDFELSLDRIGRGVRRTVALQAHLVRQRRDDAEKAAAGRRARAEEKTQRRHQVARAVACSLGDDHRLDTEQAETCASELWERLIEDPEIDCALALAEHPLEEIVIRLCRDMGIRPDPAWLDPEYSGAEWDAEGRPVPGDRGAEGPPDPAGQPYWPLEGPESGRYWYIKPSEKAPNIVTGWHDIDTRERLDRPPWELKPGKG
jgi:hypothetical protein